MTPSNRQADGLLINPTDFESIRLEISLFNHTSRMEIGPSEDINLLEFDDQTFTLTVPPSSCAEGHQLSLKLTARFLKMERRLSATVKAISVDRSKLTDLVQLQSLQFDSTSFEEFFEIYDARQKEIMKFMSAARGVE